MYSVLADPQSNQTELRSGTMQTRSPPGNEDSLQEAVAVLVLETARWITTGFAVIGSFPMLNLVVT